MGQSTPIHAYNVLLNFSGKKSITIVTFSFRWRDGMKAETRRVQSIFS